MMNHDVYESMLAFMSSQTMRDAGINEPFAKLFARNHARYYHYLPESAREKLCDEFSVMAYQLSELEGVARKHSEPLERELVRWFLHLNLLLALVGPTAAAAAGVRYEN